MPELSSRRPQLIIWDCDGVLIDSESIVARVHARALNRIGLHISAKKILQKFAGASDKDLYASFERALGRPLPNDYHATVQEGIAQLYRSILEPTVGIRDVLGIVGSRIKICVASNSSPEKLRLGLAVTDLDRWFLPHVFSAAQVAKGKPAPDLFLFAANELGVAAPDCLVVEDSVNGVRAGVRAGMKVVGFSMHSQDRDDQTRRLLAEGAVAVAHDPVELLDLIDRSG
ncbi:HAD-IA family hydrolase [Bradyrhizobium sp. Arg62]|uniref:HAD family hydrolase n=1 Tax=Bradyrhizobium brasilense TaxID=1419277 RepID=UPI001E53D935|nr:HAD-IA family hydrolase [Bradyrhizobium brasilense]MCC8944215.1 HAD-IA family hydrolase [Bradyrhizobium brasilense]